MVTLIFYTVQLYIVRGTLEQYLQLELGDEFRAQFHECEGLALCFFDVQQITRFVLFVWLVLSDFEQLQHDLHHVHLIFAVRDTTTAQLIGPCLLPLLCLGVRVYVTILGKWHVQIWIVWARGRPQPWSSQRSARTWGPSTTVDCSHRASHDSALAVAHWDHCHD